MAYYHIKIKALLLIDIYSNIISSKVKNTPASYLDKLVIYFMIFYIRFETQYDDDSLRWFFRGVMGKGCYKSPIYSLFDQYPTKKKSVFNLKLYVKIKSSASIKVIFSYKLVNYCSSSYYSVCVVK